MEVEGAMTDNALARSNRFYPRKATGYPCDQCSCNNTEAGRCIFMRENALGITAGFSPSLKYRRTHGKDVRDSPLMQSFQSPKPIDNHISFDHVLPDVKLPYFPIKSWNGMMSTLKRMRTVRRKLG